MPLVRKLHPVLDYLFSLPSFLIYILFEFCTQGVLGVDSGLFTITALPNEHDFERTIGNLRSGYTYNFEVRYLCLKTRSVYICLSVCWSVCLSVWLSVCLSVCRSGCQYVCLSVGLSVCVCGLCYMFAMY